MSYKYIVAEVKQGRVTPTAGQGFDTSMFIECSKDIRRLPHGSKVRLAVKVKKPKSIYDTEHLYSYYGWSWSVVKAPN